MYEVVQFSREGAMQLPLDHSKEYVMTKWYGGSVAVFREDIFKKYMNQLSNMAADQPFGRSVMRFFVSAAVTMADKDDQGWYLPQELRAYMGPDQETIVCQECPDANAKEFMGALPDLLIAAQPNIGGAIEMTVKKHTQKE